MDELTQVRELRSDAPHPDRGQLAPGRQKLMDAAQRGGRARRLRTDWRLATVGAVAALTVTVLLGGQLWGGDEKGAVGQQPAYTVELGGAADILLTAADIVAEESAPTPHDGQWVYERTSEADFTDEEQPALQKHEKWTRYADPGFEHGRMGDDHSPREEYRFLADLPHDVDKVKEMARAFYPGGGRESRAEHDYRSLSALAGAYPAPPEGLAAVYRAMATIPHLKAAKTTDSLGREVIALYLPGYGAGRPGTLHEILLDADTYTYLGFRGVATTDQPDPFTGERAKKGEVVDDAVIDEVALVDKKGERP